MKKTRKQFLTLLFSLIFLICSGITVFAADSQTAKVVTTFADFKTAVQSGQPVRLGANITASSDVGTTSSYIDKDITIYGDGYSLNMGKYQFWLTGSHSINISDLTINTDTSNSSQRYGLFCIRGGSATGSNFVWETKFHNLTFNGSALLGTYNTDDYTATKRMFGSAAFTGNTNITITNPYSAHNGVVYARNISISDTFVMQDNIQGKNTGATNPTYQHYFKSAGTGGVDSEPNNTVAYGTFSIADGANVTIERSPGQGTDGSTSAYYRSLIFGYADYNFGEASNFYAKAGTNLTSASGLEYRSAVIRSNNANSFIVNKDADVKLETDLYNTSSSAASKNSYGYTVLSLKKSGSLDIRVDQGAVLDIKADGRDVTPSYGTRAQAPVVIWGKGSSATTVAGDLKVYSENANGWYYAYDTSAAGKASFTVEGTGNVDITANNLGKKSSSEYAAFEAYGNYDVDITVKDGGKMKVFSNGYRGMSLAGAGSYKNKNILVTGAGSELAISGVHWAIAAETQPILSITAKEGGKIDLKSTGDVGDGYTNAGSAPSTVYSVGPTTYNVDGVGSEINLYHNGGTYSAIFHDGYGALKINVTNGGEMDVYNKNTGTDTSARRAAITAQSTYLGPYKSYDNAILVEGEGSSLTVVNENPNTHGNGGDTGLYPSGAVSFNSSAKGNIVIKDGGNFTAVSSSLAPTIHLFEGKITLDNPGEFDIRNNSVSSTTGKNSSYATSGQAVYNERYAKGSKYATAIEFVDCDDVIVWSVLDNNYGFADEYIDNRWEDVSFTANNKTVTNVGKDGLGGDTKLPLNQFDLSAYGRIAGTGDGGPIVVPEKSAPPTINDVYEGDGVITGTGVPTAAVTVILYDGTEETVTVDSNGNWSLDNDDLQAGDIIRAYQVESGKLPSDEVYTVVLAKVAVSEAPRVNNVYTWSYTVTGTGIPGSKIFVTFPNGETVEGTVTAFAMWSVQSPVSLAGYKGELIEAYQVEDGKSPSAIVNVEIKED